MRLLDLLDHAAASWPEVEALRDDVHGYSATYREVAATVHAVGGGLRARGVGRGDRIALVSKNRAELALACFAVTVAGAVAVPLSWRLTDAELSFLLADCGARMVLSEAPFSERLRALGRVPVVDVDAEWADLASAPPLDDDGDDGDVAVQLYTSGTTGRPKGATLTHRAVCANVLVWRRDAMPMEPGRSRYLQVTPMSHVGGYAMLATTWSSGGTEVLHPEFTPGGAGAALAAGDITHVVLVPAMMRWILLDPGNAGRTFAGLERILYGGSTIPVDLLREAQARFRCRFVQAYGLTETMGVVTVLGPDDHDRVAAGDARLARSAGRAALGTRVRVLAAPGEVGEIVVRTDWLASGYHGLPEETALSFRDGWFHTGDLGRMDQDGLVTIVDRVKDMIVVGGEKVFPSEVEEVLRCHPAVSDVVVVGVPHPVWIEAVSAVIVLRPGVLPDPDLGRALIRSCRDTLASYKRPTGIEFVTSLPRNPAGKVDRSVLRAERWRAEERKV